MYTICLLTNSTIERLWFRLPLDAGEVDWYTGSNDCTSKAYDTNIEYNKKKA